MARSAFHSAAPRSRPLPVADADHFLATASLALGVLGLVLVALDWAGTGVLVGLAGMVAALAGQMLSRTRGERWVDITGLLVSFLAVAVGAAVAGLV